MRGSLSNHGQNVKILMFGVQMLSKLYLILTLHHGEHGLLLLKCLTPTMHAVQLRLCQVPIC